MNLKYLFTVEFEDGTLFSQTDEDQSTMDPTKSAFYDVLQTKKKIKYFLLTNSTQAYGVDLVTGEFKINGTKFEVEGDNQLPEINPEFRLIYLRRHYHSFNLEREELGHVVKYQIGWQTTINGKNYQQTILIK